MEDSFLPQETLMNKIIFIRGKKRSQFGTLEKGAHSKYKPFVFTEQGIAMLSSVLRSDRAIKVNIAIMGAFVSLRELLQTNEELNRKLVEMEKKYDEQFQIVFKVFRKLMEHPVPKRNEVGFKLSLINKDKK